MKYTSQGIEATHEEMVRWLDWRARKMLASGMEPKLVQQWGALTGAWLSTGELYLRPSSKECGVCKGTGVSPIAIAAGKAPCHACGGTGQMPENAVLFPAKASGDAREA